MRSTSVQLCMVLLLVVAEGLSFPWLKWGRCPGLGVQQSFNLTNYMGKWYIQEGLNLDLTQGEGRCGSATYTLDAYHNVVDVYNQQISKRTNKWESISGNAVAMDPSKKEGRFLVKLYIWGFIEVKAEYDVLGTDYNTYSVVNSCKNVLFFFHVNGAWLLSRKQDLDGSGDASKFYENVNSILIKNNIDPTTFVKVDQRNCTA